MKFKKYLREMMTRKRLSGNKTYGTKNIKCKKCGQVIIKKGEPMTPLYFEDKKGDNYCTKCGN